MSTETIRLTSLASCAGCAAKAGPGTLAAVLKPLLETFRPQDHPRLLAGVTDDAAVYQIDDETAVVQTIDFFPPVVDDPYTFGAVAAANAMSDVYAMGGEVVMALNVAAFPEDMAPEIISEILRGGAEKVAKAGGIIAGGHTVIDDEPKYGLSVMGLVHPQRILAKSGAQPGDALVLTKALGTGLVLTAAKRDVVAAGAPRCGGREHADPQPPRLAPGARGRRPRHDRRHRLRDHRPRLGDRRPQRRAPRPCAPRRCRCCPAPSATRRPGSISAAWAATRRAWSTRRASTPPSVTRCATCSSTRRPPAAC